MLINRDEAIAAVEAERLEDQRCLEDRAYNRALDHALQALRNLPTVSVSDDMIERAARAIVKRNWPSLADIDVDDMWADHAGDVRAALEAALGATLSDGWQPIDTAPKDGTQILAWCVCRETGDGWLAADVGWWEPADHWIGVADGIVGPTHWRPLPAPPTIGE